MHSREQLSGFPSLYHFFLISMYVCMHLCVCGKLEEGVRSAGIRLRWDYELSTWCRCGELNSSLLQEQWSSLNGYTISEDPGIIVTVGVHVEFHRICSNQMSLRVFTHVASFLSPSLLQSLINLFSFWVNDYKESTLLLKFTHLGCPN